MEQPRITDNMAAALVAPLPEEALYKKQGTDLTFIKPIYVVQRLNEVFGIGGWSTQAEVINQQVDGTIIVKTTLTIPALNTYYQQFGAFRSDDPGVSYKSAATEGLIKCASYLGIGMSVYMGKQNLSPHPETAPLKQRISTINKYQTPFSRTQHNPKFESKFHQGNNYIVYREIDELPDIETLELFRKQLIDTCTNSEKRDIAMNHYNRRLKALGY